MEYKELYETNEFIGRVLEGKEEVQSESIDRPSIDSGKKAIAYINSKTGKFMKNAENQWNKARTEMGKLNDELGSLFFGMVELRGFLSYMSQEIGDSDPEKSDKIWELKRRVDELEALAELPRRSFEGKTASPLGAMKRAMKEAFPKIEKELKDIAKEIQKLKI